MSRLKRKAYDPKAVTKEISTLRHHNDKQNKDLPKLPANIKVHTRPINHAAVVSPFAGSKVQKVVYVSRKTPVIAAVKRVKKFLEAIEKRALQSADVSAAVGGKRNGGGDAGLELARRLDSVSEQLGRDGEEVLVKACGRAMEQGLRIAEWFRQREDEMSTKVEVRTKNVSVVDDLVEEGNSDDDHEHKDSDSADMEHEKKANGDVGPEEGHTTTLESGDTTMELLGNLDPSVAEKRKEKNEGHADGAIKSAEAATQPEVETAKPAKRKRPRRKRKQYGPDDVPEARIRWVKSLEVAISLRA